MKRKIVSVGWFFGDWAALWSDNTIRGCTWTTAARFHMEDYVND